MIAGAAGDAAANETARAIVVGDRRRCGCDHRVRSARIERAHPLVVVKATHDDEHAPEQAHRLVPIKRFNGAWSVAALVIAFARAHVGHPFARCVLPLIPTVLALCEWAVEGTRVFEKRCGLLVDSLFARAHLKPTELVAVTVRAAQPSQLPKLE
jgi:hypothetical protein